MSNHYFNLAPKIDKLKAEIVVGFYLINRIL